VNETHVQRFFTRQEWKITSKKISSKTKKKRQSNIGLPIQIVSINIITQILKCGCRRRIRTSTEKLGNKRALCVLYPFPDKNQVLHPRDRRACLPVSTSYKDVLSKSLLLYGGSKLTNQVIY
jgi:hypothetical protein